MQKLKDLFSKFSGGPWPRRLLASLVVAWALGVSALSLRHHKPPASARGFTSGGGMILGQTGLNKVTTNSAGLLAGSGTVSNPLTATISTGGIITGTGSSGSPLTATETGDISAVTAGSGLTGGGASGAVTLAVGAGSGILAAGTVTAVDVGTGITISSNHVTLNQSATTCANGQAITTTTATGGETCGSVPANPYGGTHFEWNNEWLSGGATTAGNAVEPYQCSSGTGGVCATNSASAQYAQTRIGINEMGTGTTSNATGRAAWRTDANAIDFRAGSFSIEWTGGWEVLSTSGVGYYAIFGFWDTNTIDQVDGCYFLYDERNTAAGGQNGSNLNRLQCVCAQNSTRTIYLLNGSGNSDESFPLGTVTVAALVAPSTNILTLKVTMTGTTRAEFFSGGTKVCDINTNIPNGSARVTGAGFTIMKSTSATTSSTMQTDRTRLVYDLTAAPSP